MKIRMALPRRPLVFGVLSLLLGITGGQVWALGPGTPPIIRSAVVYVRTNDDTAARLFAEVDVEVPGGRVPQNITSVTVLVPGESTPRALPRDRRDLGPDNNYFVDLTGAGVAGFPTGTYTFTVTDTAGGVTTVTDGLSSGTPLAAPTLTSHTDNQIIPLASPTITWSTVPGAAIYRLRIRQGFMDMNFFSQFTGGTSLTLPSGVFVPGRRYQIRLEAFDHVNGLPEANAQAVRRIQVEVQGPDVFLTFPSRTYTAGETLNLTARVWNTHTPVTVDAVVWVGIPGSADPIKVLEFKNVLLPQVLTGDVYNGPLGFSYTFNGGEPNGVYVVGFRLIDPASGETIAVTTRTFTKS